MGSIFLLAGCNRSWGSKLLSWWLKIKQEGFSEVHLPGFHFGTGFFEPRPVVLNSTRPFPCWLLFFCEKVPTSETFWFSGPEETRREQRVPGSKGMGRPALRHWIIQSLPLNHLARQDLLVGLSKCTNSLKRAQVTLSIGCSTGVVQTLKGPTPPWKGSTL